MTHVLDTVLLLALPASGKSEVRRYVASLAPEKARDDFHLGPTVQLDDFPYVHLMRRVDDELTRHGTERVFFFAPDRSFRDPRDWGTLIELLNEDYAHLVERRRSTPTSAAAHYLDRLDVAAEKVGIPPRMRGLDGRTRSAVESALEAECAALLKEKHAGYPATLEGHTLIIEFARGGKEGAPMPLAAPYGYRYSLGRLSRSILERASILYVWVTPEESRRKNEARANPDDPGSILHHGVPIDVMLNDYGVDDMDWLEAGAEARGSIAIEADGGRISVPVARFDNRVDKTSFVREDPAQWRASDVEALHGGLKTALDVLARARRGPRSADAQE